MFEKGTTERVVLGSFTFFLGGPVIVAGIVPYALSSWSMQPPLFGLPGERVVGVAAVVAGLSCLLDCFARFALEGRGAPSPIDQTEVLVVSGFYRFVRNPMYVCVVTIVAGQALILGQALLFAYAVIASARVPPVRAVLRGAATPSNIRRIV